MFGPEEERFPVHPDRICPRCNGKGAFKEKSSDTVLSECTHTKCQGRGFIGSNADKDLPLKLTKEDSKKLKAAETKGITKGMLFRGDKTNVKLIIKNITPKRVVVFPWPQHILGESSSARPFLDKVTNTTVLVKGGEIFRRFELSDQSKAKIKKLKDSTGIDLLK